jgi:hypothetical protein
MVIDLVGTKTTKTSWSVVSAPALLSSASHGLRTTQARFTNGKRPWEAAERYTEMTITEEHITSLQRLRDLPQGKRVVMGGTPPEYKQLEETGYVKTQWTNISEVLLEITDRGRQAIALAEAKRK